MRARGHALRVGDTPDTARARRPPAGRRRSRNRRRTCQTRVVPPRFLLLTDVAEQLNVSLVQARALVTSGELPAIQVGGRGQWRIEASELEAYIQRKYAEAREKTRARAGRRAGD